MAIPVTLRFWLFALLLGIVVWALNRERAATGTVKALPQQLIGEPDLYLETAQIRQYGDAGTLKYKLLASQIRHFETDALTRLTQPDLTLFNTGTLPWRSTAGTGFIRQDIGPSGLPEELVFLRDDVQLRQQDDAGRFLKLSTTHMYVYPDRQFAQTEREYIQQRDASCQGLADRR